jgi:hypothetical protein
MAWNPEPSWTEAPWTADRVNQTADYLIGQAAEMLKGPSPLPRYSGQPAIVGVFVVGKAPYSRRFFVRDQADKVTEVSFAAREYASACLGHCFLNDHGDVEAIPAVPATPPAPARDYATAADLAAVWPNGIAGTAPPPAPASWAEERAREGAEALLARLGVTATAEDVTGVAEWLRASALTLDIPQAAVDAADLLFPALPVTYESVSPWKSMPARAFFSHLVPGGFLVWRRPDTGDQS